MRRTLPRLLVLFALAAGCAPADETDDALCEGEKCDTPDGTAAQVCPLRRADAMAPGRHAFTHDAIRWPCADVKGVNTVGGDDRGQEYCEYYAVVTKPGGEIAQLGRNTGDGVTPLALDLDDAQVTKLRSDLEKVVGQCVFSSWHSDIPGPLPVCSGGGCPTFYGGLKTTTEQVRMKIEFNSNGAAADLVEKCFAHLGSQKDPYLRACTAVHKAFGTGWRRSNPTICTGVNRLFECGCGLDTNGDGKADVKKAADVAAALIPARGLRGFPLGTWSAPDELPDGCRYVNTGDGSRTLVTCDLSAADVLKNLKDPKGQCRARWANDVVVHIPLPVDKIVCDGSCAQEPWVISE